MPVTAKAAPGALVAVLGASPKQQRYSFQAVRMLKEYGYRPLPVHPAGHEVDGVPGVRSLSDINESVDTVSVYVNEKISSAEKDKLLSLKPRRVIFSPGAENRQLMEELSKAGIETTFACTLVMLQSGQF